jgi:hypothetical protein
MIMKSFLTSLFFITLFSLNNVAAQNLSHLVEKSTTEPASVAVPVDIESPIVKIEVVGLRGNFFNPIVPPPNKKGMVGNLIDRATEITQDAQFQRLRFKETGQPIEIDRDHIYYRRDNYSYTKGIILWEMFNGRMDFGLFKKHYSPASTNLSSRINSDFGAPEANGYVFRNGNRIFFSLRLKLSNP